MEKKAINRSYRYDSLNRLVSVSGQDESTMEYAFDPAGNRTMTTYGKSPAAPGAMPGAPLLPPEPAPVSPAGGTCPRCGQPVGAASKFCRTCGAPLRQEPAISAAPACSRCGTMLGPQAKFCPKCGEPVRRN